MLLRLMDYNFLLLCGLCQILQKVQHNAGRGRPSGTERWGGESCMKLNFFLPLAAPCIISQRFSRQTDRQLEAMESTGIRAGGGDDEGASGDDWLGGWHRSIKTNAFLNAQT